MQGINCQISGPEDLDLKIRYIYSWRSVSCFCTGVNFNPKFMDVYGERPPLFYISVLYVNYVSCISRVPKPVFQLLRGTHYVLSDHHAYHVHHGLITHRRYRMMLMTVAIAQCDA